MEKTLSNIRAYLDVALKGYSKGYIDKDDTAIIKGYGNSKKGVPLDFELRIEDKKVLNSLYRDVYYIHWIRRLLKNDCLRVLVNDKNSLIYEMDGQPISSDYLKELWLKVAGESIEEYKRIVEEIQKSYKQYYEQYSEYFRIIDEIYLLSEWIQYYQRHMMNLKGKLTFRKKVRKNMAVPVFNEFTVETGKLEDIRDLLLKKDVRIKFLPEDLSIEDGRSIYLAIRNANEIVNYIRGLAKLVEKGLNEITPILEAIKGQVESIRRQKFLDMIKNPIDPKIPNFEQLLIDDALRSFELEKREESKDSINDLFVNLQNSQSSALSEEEKMGLMVYKTKLYSPINKIISYMRTSPVVDSNIIEEFIKSGYQDLKAAHSSRTFSVTNRKKFRFETLFNPDVLPSYDEYKRIIMHYIPIIEASLKKVFLDEDITVYRGVRVEDYNNLGVHFLSTTIDIDTALSILEARGVHSKAILYKITLPKNSPLIFFSTELFIGSIDSKNAFNDEQKEVLIDAKNFDFKIENVIQYSNVHDAKEDIFLVEVHAIPKVLEPIKGENLENSKKI